MLPPELDNWPTESGLRIAEKVAATGRGSLSVRERLLNEVSLLDTEQCNGGIAQYFCNWRMARWLELSQLASEHLPPFARFAEGVDAVIRGSADPYAAALESPELDEWFEKHQVRLVQELRALFDSPSN